MKIKSTTNPYHDDFLVLFGSNMSDANKIQFQKNGDIVEIDLDFVRPHLLYVEQLPSSVKVGTNNVKVIGGGNTSNEIILDVKAGSPPKKIVLNDGNISKKNPYTIVFVANPATREINGSFSSDGVLKNRISYQKTITHCLHNLFTLREDLLHAGGIDAQMHLVSIFDSSLSPSDNNSLAGKITPNLMETRRTKLNSFLAKYGVTNADVVFVIYDSTTHDRATAWFTTDNITTSSPYKYDGVPRLHGHLAAIPGSAAIPLSVNTTGLTVLHEFCHAASDFVNGRVTDLYVDGSNISFNINKKWRKLATDNIPKNFGSYNGANFISDQQRDGLSYPSKWKSYHPNLTDATIPNLMDNYWQTGNPQSCLLDQLTKSWLRDRIAIKLNR